MRVSPITDYVASLRHDLRAGGATERTHYSTLKALIEGLQPGVDAAVEQKRIDCGAPDFHIRRGEVIVGHIEAKNVGCSLDEAERSAQLKDRYLPALQNVILTNFLEFRWYVDRERRLTAALGSLGAGGAIRPTAQGQVETLRVLGDFLAHEPQGATGARDLAVRLARLAHEIRITIEEAFSRGQISDTLSDLRQAVQKQLIPDLTDQRFADMFAQTLVYGFFAARCSHTTGRFQRYGAAAEIPKTNPFLRQLFEAITGVALDDEPFVGYVDDLIQLLDRTDMAGVLADFGQRTGRADPVVHFYETFLKEYDPKLRELRGVYYTPEPVVSYMVRSVDYLLRTRFSLSGGLADTAQITYERETEDGRKETATAPRVLVLDPALGTGTFLYAVVDLVRERFRQRRDAGMWSSFVREQLLPRLFGFELLMAPYAVAHLKLGMQLAAQDLSEAERAIWAYDFSGGERLGVYLTNTLEEAIRRSDELFGFLRVLTQEANAAAEIKRDKPVMVVIGNPPYSASSANRGDWISSLVADYKRGLRERKIHLDNDYVKFLRFAQWRVERTGHGVVAMITDNSYLDGPTFRRMRECILESFPAIWILNLHGNSRRKETAPDGSPDKNVFDIREGAAILLLSRDDTGAKRQVQYQDCWGSRDAKYRFLESTDVSSTDWQSIEPAPPDFLFVPPPRGPAPDYAACVSVRELFGVWGSGFNTDRDDLCVDFDQRGLRLRMSRFFRGDYDDDFRRRYSLRPSSSYDPEAKRNALQYDAKAIRLCLSRPFDHRSVYYQPGFTSRPVADVMAHMLRPNLALIAARQTKETFAVLATRLIAMHKIVTVYDRSSLFPLYVYPGTGDTISRDQRIEEAVKAAVVSGLGAAAQERLRLAVKELFPNAEYPRWPNLDPLSLADLQQRLGLRFLPDGQGDLADTFGPEDVFAYIYAVLHCPTYRTRYADFLKRDFPRVPFTSNRELFANLALKGRDLVALHLMESPMLETLITSFPEPGSDKVERVAYNDNQRRVYINKIQYFDGVPKQVWEFHVGGYQVCEKWLKDRKDRKLDNNDLTHYQKIVVALHETIRLMAEIDALVPSWPLT